MSQIVNFFKQLIDLTIGLTKFLINLVMDLVTVIQLLLESITKLPTILGFLPSTALALVMACFSIVIIYKVLGREG